MHRELLIKAFKKVERELISEGINSPSVNQCAQRLSEIISEIFPYGDRRLRDFYNETRAGTEGDINIPQPKVILALSQYLGYGNYKEFLTKNSIDEVKAIQEESKVPQKKNKLKLIVILFVLVVVIVFFGYQYFNKQRWMEWEETHYVEVSFDSEKLSEGNLKVYKEERIIDFKKVTPTCASKFFNDDGSVRVWYGKNKDGDLEYFTGYGLHPLTGKTLKPITQYMIGKYICK
ncbi:MAG TPA: hypothetical protein PLV43_08885 [Aequorivita sp.]|nr:hypothetical protein [Aequorivita sp.]